MGISEEQRKSLELCVGALEREYGRGVIIKLGSENVAPWPSVSTGIMTLDLALGIGGLPLGRMVEIFGNEAAGKSTLALSTIAEAQKEGLVCAYVDVENALDPIYMQAIGIDMDELYLSQPSTGEQALNIVQKLAATNAVSVIVVDSVSALVPQAERSGDIGDSFIGHQARMMSQALRMLSDTLAKSKTLVIFINQMREKMTLYGNPNTTSGGKALRFYSSVRIELAKEEDLKSKAGEFIGIKTRAKIIKNKLAPALKIAKYDILYGKGIDKVGCVTDVAIELGILQRVGAYYKYHDAESTLAQGRDNLIIYLKEDNELLEQIKKEIIDARAD